MDFDDRIHRDLVEPYSNDASASSFGWNFQYAAGIFLFLNYADDTTKVIMESEKQDIELVLFEDKHIYAQAKSAQDYTAINASNKNKKIKDALISLINTFGKNSDGQFIYVSNIKGTITEENDSINHVSSYTGFLQSSKDYITTLFSEIKSKMKKNIEDIKNSDDKTERQKAKKIAEITLQISNLDSFDFNKFSVLTIVPFGGPDTNRYQKIKDTLIDFLINKLKIDYYKAISVCSRYIDFLRYQFEESAGEPNTSFKKTLDTASLVWPVVSYLAFDFDNDVDKIEGIIDFSIDENIRNESQKILKDEDLFLYHQRFSFSNSLIQKYREFKESNPKTKEPDFAFVKNNWENYKDEFTTAEFNESNPGSAIFEVVVKFTLLKILSVNSDITKVSSWLGAKRYGD